MSRGTAPSRSGTGGGHPAKTLSWAGESSAVSVSPQGSQATSAAGKRGSSIDA